MKFVCLRYLNKELWDALAKDDREALIEKCLAHDDVLRGNACWTGAGEVLQSSSTAKTLRSNGGQVFVTDGPYAETKEQLGGFGVMEAGDLQHAVELLRTHPAIAFGAFEIRAIDEALTQRGNAAAAPSAPVTGGKFACLAYVDEGNWNAMSKAEHEATIAECFAYDKELRKSGQALGGVALQSASAAKTLRFRDGSALITDGPYAETREVLAGAAITRFSGMDSAVAAWSKHPCLGVGWALEIRPVDEAFNARIAARRRQAHATPELGRQGVFAVTN
jgi:hypothetical protein